MISMKVQIVGAGSVGLLVASYFLENGLDVVLVGRNPEQLEQLSSNGLTRINNDETSINNRIKVTSTLIADADITIVTTKSYQVQGLFVELAKLPEKAALLFMQNGLAHYEPSLTLPQQHIAFASLQFGALREGFTTVRHTGVGVFKLAVAKGELSVFSKLLRCNVHNFPIIVEEDAYAMLFEKALLNCFVNPLTALLQVKNGVLIRNEQAFALLQQLYEELKFAFSEEMIHFPFEKVVALCENTAANTSSMLMDRLNERQSEVDAIVWPIIELANKKGYELPTLRTLYYCITAIEKERDGQ